MNLKKLLVIGLVGLSSLVGCGNTNNDSTEASSSSIEVVSSESSSETSSVSLVSGHNYAEESWYTLPADYSEFTFGLSVTGVLIDVAVDKELVTGTSDTFSFSFTKNTTATCTVTSSNEDVFTITKNGEFSYTINAVHEGNAILTIKDAMGIERYSHVIYVRDGKSVEEMSKYLSDVEYWQSYAGYGDTYVLTFFFGGEVSISGSLQAVPFESYDATYELTNETETEYQYTFTDEKSAKHQAGLTGFNISKTGDFMYLLYKNGVAAIMFPNTRVID